MHDQDQQQTEDRRRTGCASTEEPGAVVPHAGICEGGAGQPASLPQSVGNSNTAHTTSMNSTSSATRNRAKGPLVLAVIVLLLCGVGYVWSFLFDLPGHSVVALFSIPALLASLIHAGFLWSKLGSDPTCRRLIVIGIISTVFTLVVCFTLLLLQSIFGPKPTVTLSLGVSHDLSWSAQMGRTEQDGSGNGG